jgi:isochorismate hydrolase
MTEASRTLIDRDRAVLVVIDVQERLAAVMDHRDQVVRATSRVTRTAALVDIPIIVTRQYPEGLGGTNPELEDVLVAVAQEGAHVSGVDKTAFCCARESEFMEALRATGRTQVVLTGMETHICVAQTALALLDEFQVQIVADAVCSRDDANHAVALDRLREAGAVVTTSESVMYEAVGRAATDEFKALLKIVKE